MKKDLPDHEIFSRAGHKLSDTPVQSKSDISSKIEEAEPFDIKIDPEKPVTKLRMRFSDGTQKVQGFIFSKNKKCAINFHRCTDSWGTKILN